MSLCYDFEKWTMITLATVAISLSVGLLLQVVHGDLIDKNGTELAIGTDIPIPEYCEADIKEKYPEFDDDLHHAYVKACIFMQHIFNQKLRDLGYK
jgi:hypothetical protein